MVAADPLAFAKGADKTATLTVAGDTIEILYEENGKNNITATISATDVETWLGSFGDPAKNDSISSPASNTVWDGIQNKSQEYAKFTSCSAIPGITGSPSDPALASEIMAGFSTTATEVAKNGSVSEKADFASALKDMAKAQNEWAAGNKTAAGEKLATALKSLAKVAGCQ
ncbi:MAG: hypothetical protein R8K20_08710 [Gallionellaceae bacterium]